MARATPSGGDGRRRLGSRGEEAAAEFLARRGYAIVERNYRCRLGEIDLVVTDGTTIVFVEVKLRYDRFAAYEAVHLRKQERISRAAFDFLERRGMLARPARFDVVAVDGATLECSHTPDAFDCAFGY
jgi:putative endonuclease